ASPSPPSTEPPANAAVHAFRRFASLFAQQDYASLSEVVTDDFVLIDERPVTRGLRDRSASDMSMRVMAEQGASFSSRTLATRGDRFALLISQRTFHGDVTEDFATDAAFLVEVAVDGRMCGAAAYARDDLDRAVADLDQRYIDGEGAPYAGALA